jgi:hypothetical protein
MTTITMKKYYLVCLLLIGGLLSGCANRYDITLRSGNVITTKGKPQDDGRGYYTYTDIDGVTKRVSAGQVRQIAPHTNSRNDKSNFFAPGS